jgi:hypothetical protein
LTGKALVAGSSRGVAICAAVLFAHTLLSPARAQTVDEMKDAMEMMVGSAAICSDYLKRPEVLEDTRQLAREQLGKVGLSADDADAFSDQITAQARQETNTETQQQVACEIINIPAIK